MTAALYMLDTNTVIRIRSRASEFVDRFQRLSAGEAIISAITYGELRFGADKSAASEKAHAMLARMVASIPIDPLPVSAASAYAAIRLDLERRGQVIGPNDLWIAAHARSIGVTVVTTNEREFRRVPGLAVENWAAT